MNNFIKNTTTEHAVPLLDFTYQNKHCRVDFLNTGFDTFPGQFEKNTNYPLSAQHTHSVFHLLMFSEGEYHYLHNGNRINFIPGTFTISSPNEPHKFGPFPCTNSNSYFYLTFSLIEIETGNTLDIEFKTFLEIFTGEKIPELKVPMNFNKRQMSIFENLTAILTRQLNSGIRFSSFEAGMTMLDIINFILHECCPESVSAEGKIDSFRLDESKKFIEKRYSQPISIAELAAIAALEPSYFIRKFKKAFQVTPINYQMELKINAAKTLLKTTDFNLSKIAEQVGINDIYYFSRLFKKVTGVAPGKFRSN